MKSCLAFELAMVEVVVEAHMATPLPMQAPPATLRSCPESEALVVEALDLPMGTGTAVTIIISVEGLILKQAARILFQIFDSLVLTIRETRDAIRLLHPVEIQASSLLHD